MTTENVTFMRDKSYPFHVEDTRDGTTHTRYGHATTEVKARRVADGTVQVEIWITEVKNERAYKTHGCLTLGAELQAELLKVLQ